MKHYLCVHNVCTLDLWVQLTVSLNWAGLNIIPLQRGGNSLSAVWTVRSGTLDEPCRQKK